MYKTEENKQAFLKEYPKYAQITETAKVLELNPSTIHRWVEGDEVFSQQFKLLKKEIEKQEAEFYVKTIKEIVSDKETPPQSRLLGSFFMLKGLEPDKWREKTQPVLQIGDIKVLMAIPPYDDEKIEGEVKQIE